MDWVTKTYQCKWYIDQWIINVDINQTNNRENKIILCFSIEQNNGEDEGDESEKHL